MAVETQQVVQVVPFWTIIKEKVVAALPQIISGAAFFIIFLIIGLILKVIICSMAKKGTPKRLVLNLIGKCVFLLFLILGVIVGLGTAGYNVSSLVVSLGLVGFAISYALKDVISNVLAGAMIIINKTFKLGETVTVNGFTGDVKNIDMRYTQLDNVDARIMVPNSTSHQHMSSQI